MSTRLLIFAAVCSLLTAEAPRQDIDKLQGTWKLVKLVADGKPAHADLMEKTRLTFSGKQLLSIDPSGERQESTVKLDAAKNPKEIDFTVNRGPQKGAKALGIYSLEGDELTLCFSDPGQQRPSSFE